LRVYTRIMDHACYCIALRKVSRRLTALYDEAMAPFGITISQFSQMRSIKRRQPVSLTELAEALELDRSTVGRNTKILQRMGLVAAVASDEDQRETMLSLTPEALALLTRATPVWRDVQAKVEGRLAAAEFDRVLAELRDL
jgi:DNA-binding MarR family transcriptional regulator